MFKVGDKLKNADTETRIDKELRWIAEQGANAKANLTLMHQVCPPGPPPHWPKTYVGPAPHWLRADLGEIPLPGAEGAAQASMNLWHDLGGVVARATGQISNPLNPFRATLIGKGRLGHGRTHDDSPSTEVAIGVGASSQGQMFSTPNNRPNRG